MRAPSSALPNLDSPAVFRWGSYVLVPREAWVDSMRAALAAIPAADRILVAPTLTDAGDDELWHRRPDGQLVARWPMAVVFDNVIGCALTLLERRRPAETPPRRDLLHHDEIAELIARMRSVAFRLPYGGGLRAWLELPAAVLEQEVIAWPGQFFRNPPRDPRRLLELRIDVLLWTIRELRHAVLMAAESWSGQPPAAYVHGLWAPFHQIEMAAAGARVFDARDVGKNLQARVDRLPARMRKNRTHDLLAYVLHDVLTYGPFLSDGTRRL